MANYGAILHSVQYSSVAQLCSTLWDPTNCHIQASLSITNSQSSPKLMSIELVMSSSHLILSSPSPPAPNRSEHQGLFQWVSSSQLGGQSIGVSASTSVLPMNTQNWSPLGWTCNPRDSQESSPTPQFKNINSSALSFLYGPTLTSIFDYWKNHSLD